MIGSLCSGILGLDLAVEAHTGRKLAWCAEINPAASRVIAARADVTNYGDFRDVTPPAVDILCAGFPCQPVSAAGKRAGVNDERWLFRDICDLLGRMDPPPRLLVFENVRGLLTANGGDAMARVVEGLARCGYVGSWRTVRASDVGAPHRRQRVFIAAEHADRGRLHQDGTLAAGSGVARGYDVGGASGGVAAVSDSGRLVGRGSGGPWAAGRGDKTGVGRVARTSEDASHADGARPQGPEPTQRRDVYAWSGRAAADTDGIGLGRRTQRDEWTATGLEPSRRYDADRLDTATTDADDLGRERRREPRRRGTGPTHHNFGPYTAAVERWEHILSRPAPAPVDARGRLSAPFVEWMMGYPEGWVTDVLERRTDALRCLGNAVVPQQAAYALALLERVPVAS